MPLVRPAAIFFDLDGTLIDSAPDLGAAADKMRTDRGLPSLADSLYRPMAGAGARGMLKIAFEITPEHPDFLIMREEFFRNYEASIGAADARTFAFDGVDDMLRSLEAIGLPWGIVTNKSKRFTEPLVALMPVLRGVCAVVSGDTTPHAKPHPAPLLEACRLASHTGKGLQTIDPKQCWYLGDDKRDIDAGKAAGMTTIAVTWGYEGEHELSTWGADYVLHKPSELTWLLG
ncbi:MAG: Phosphoglycolate phosphatase [Pseudomonadota bacterium]